jgi:hypothetical protein
MKVYQAMNTSALKIVFHGENATNFRQGFEQLIDSGHQIVDLSDELQKPGEREHYESADVIVGIKLNAQLPAPRALPERMLLTPACCLPARRCATVLAMKTPLLNT